jgi:hypothetical protein
MADHARKLLEGKKFSRRHSTVIQDAVLLLRKAKSLPHVSKIVLAEINRCRPGEPHLRFAPIPAGFKLMVRGRTAVQIFFVYTTNPTTTQQSLEEEWARLCN